MDATQRLAALRAKAERVNAERVRAQTQRDTAQANLNELLSRYGVSSVEELEQLARQAQTTAEEALAQAEAALA